VKDTETNVANAPHWLHKPEGNYAPLVAFTGYAGVGKNAAAKTLCCKGWLAVSFADPLRRALMALDPIIDVGTFGNGALCQQRLETIVHKFGWDAAKREFPEIRCLLQRMGTEVGREIIGSETWVNIAERTIAASGLPCVITDLRFTNEAAMVKRRGGKIIRITKPGCGPVNQHCSEVQAIDVDDVIDNCGSLEELHAKVLEVCA
jgi:hypothetical protein